MDKLYEVRKIIRSILSEELIGLYTLKKHPNKPILDIYKNPKSIKKMESWMRGISDKNGDLFVLDDGGKYVIHNQFSTWLNQRGYPVPAGDHVWYDQDNVLCWMRLDNTNKFYLSETYQEGDIEYIQENSIELVEKVRQKNPSFIFIPEGINLIE